MDQEEYLAALIEWTDYVLRRVRGIIAACLIAAITCCMTVALILLATLGAR